MAAHGRSLKGLREQGDESIRGMHSGPLPLRAIDMRSIAVKVHLASTLDEGVMDAVREQLGLPPWVRLRFSALDCLPDAAGVGK